MNSKVRLIVSNTPYADQAKGKKDVRFVKVLIGDKCFQYTYYFSDNKEKVTKTSKGTIFFFDFYISQSDILFDSEEI